MRKAILTTLEGLLWASVGGAATSLLEIRQYMTQWKEFDFDWPHIASLAVAGAILGGAMFLRDLAQRHNVAAALETVPPSMAGLGSMGTLAGGPVISPAPGAPQAPGD